MPRKVKCVQCEHGLFVWSMAVTKLPCDHYCHSSCIEALPQNYKEVSCCQRCGCKIQKEWLEGTLEQQSTYEEVDSKVFYEEFEKELSLRALDTIGRSFDNIGHKFGHISLTTVSNRAEVIKNVTGYIDMVQQIFTLVQQMEENDKRRKT